MCSKEVPYAIWESNSQITRFSFVQNIQVIQNSKPINSSFLKKSKPIKALISHFYKPMMR
jgi:hypothetical protein